MRERILPGSRPGVWRRSCVFRVTMWLCSLCSSQNSVPGLVKPSISFCLTNVTEETHSEDTEKGIFIFWFFFFFYLPLIMCSQIEMYGFPFSSSSQLCCWNSLLSLWCFGLFGASAGGAMGISQGPNHFRVFWAPGLGSNDRLVLICRCLESMNSFNLKSLSK